MWLDAYLKLSANNMEPDTSVPLRQLLLQLAIMGKSLGAGSFWDTMSTIDDVLMLAKEYGVPTNHEHHLMQLTKQAPPLKFLKKLAKEREAEMGESQWEPRPSPYANTDTSKPANVNKLRQNHQSGKPRKDAVSSNPTGRKQGPAPAGAQWK